MVPFRMYPHHPSVEPKTPDYWEWSSPGRQLPWCLSLTLGCHHYKMKITRVTETQDTLYSMVITLLVTLLPQVTVIRDCQTQITLEKTLPLTNSTYELLKVVEDIELKAWVSGELIENATSFLVSEASSSDEDITLAPKLQWKLEAYKKPQGWGGVLSEDFSVGSWTTDLKFGCIFGTVWGFQKCWDLGYDLHRFWFTWYGSPGNLPGQLSSIESLSAIILDHCP